MIRTSIIAAAISTSLVVAAISPACAETIDLSTQTCKQFLAGDGDDMKVTLAWLDAYYKSEDAPPVIDTNKLVSNSKKLGEYCQKNPTIGLITATGKLFGK